MPPVSRLRTESITDHEQNEYQKINISSRESTGMSRESFQKIAHDIMGAIEMRQRYMANRLVFLDFNGPNSFVAIRPSSQLQIVICELQEVALPKPPRMIQVWTSMYPIIRHQRILT